MTTTPQTKKKYTRWGQGAIFSPVHRLVASWITCSPNWQFREEQVVDLFGTKNRRTTAMKDPRIMTSVEKELLADLMKVDYQHLAGMINNDHDPYFKIQIQQHTNPNPIPIP